MRKAEVCDAGLLNKLLLATSCRLPRNSGWVHRYISPITNSMLASENSEVRKRPVVYLLPCMEGTWFHTKDKAGFMGSLVGLLCCNDIGAISAIQMVKNNGLLKEYPVVVWSGWDWLVPWTCGHVYTVRGLGMQNHRDELRAWLRSVRGQLDSWVELPSETRVEDEDC